jgi:predicted Zn-dependent protease
VITVQKAHGLAPDDPAISSSLGELPVETGHSQEATLLLQSALESHQGNVEISLSLAKALESQGKAADAISLTQKLYQGGRSSEAEPEFRTVLQTNPRNLKSSGRSGEDLV